MELSPEEKTLERIKKILSSAGRRVGNDGRFNDHEAAAAARRLFKMLEGGTLPLRYIVGKGAEVRLLPNQFLLHPDRKSVLKKVIARRRNLFLEGHRLKDQHGATAIEQGFLAFDRFGYTVFVKLGDVQVFF